MAWIAALGGLGVWAFWGLPLRQDVTQFVPSAEDRELSQIARDVIGSELSRTIVIAIRGRTQEDAIAAAAELAERARGLPGIAWVRRGPPPEIERAFYDLYFARRYAFFASSPGEARARLTDPALAEAAARLRAELGSPTAMLVRRIAQEDPLLAFLDHLRRLRQSSEGGPQVIDGQLVSEDGHALVLLATEGSPFSAALSEPVLEGLERIERELDEAHGGELVFEQSSIHRFALEAQRGIRADVERISTLSMIAIVALFLVLYRGPRFLIVGALALGAGTVAGTAACRLIFGGVHGITLAFGSSLLGVGIDYVSHYVNHYVLSPERSAAGDADPEATMRKLWPGLALGAGTTIAGLAGLGWTSFPSMQEMAVFAAFGVSASLLAARYLVPPWMPARVTAPITARMSERACAALWTALQKRSAPFLALPAIAVVITALGLPRIEWVDDIRALNEANPDLLAEDRRVRDRIAQGEAGRFVVVRGASDEIALARNDEVYRALAEARAAGELRAFRSVHPLLRSEALQREVEDAVLGAPRMYERTLEALAGQGFVATMFEPFRASLVRRDPLGVGELQASPVFELVRPFRARLGQDVAYLSFIEGLAEPAALRARLEPIEGATYFDQAALMTAAYRTFRTRTTELLAVGLLVVIGMCIARYRSLVLGLASVLPALLATATSLGILALIGEPVNLMHLVGALLVLSMGEDYAVFLIESRADAREVATTMVGIAVACLTTVLSFGLLAMSSHPAMRALGLMAALGVGLSLVLAPLGLVVAKRWEGRRA